MPAHYSVIQYVPDPVTGERVNVGVVAYAEGEVRAKFLTNWQRVKSLWGKDCLERERIEALFEGIDQDRLLEMIDTWHSAIQLTRPCGSIRTLNDAIEEAARRFLVDSAPPTRDYKVHEDVVVYARLTLLAAITQKLGVRNAKGHVRRDMQLPGRDGFNRRFDLGVKNGEPLHVIQAISFAGTKSTERSVEAAAFLANEIRDRLPFTVVIAPPLEPDVRFENSVKTLEIHGAKVVEEDGFINAARNIADDLAVHLGGRSAPHSLEL